MSIGALTGIPVITVNGAQLLALSGFIIYGQEYALSQVTAAGELVVDHADGRRLVIDKYGGVLTTYRP